MCVFTISIVYLHSVTVANVPVNSAVSSGDVCVCVCLRLGYCTVSTAVAKGKLVCVGSLSIARVCVCVFTFLPADVFLALQDLLDP